VECRDGPGDVHDPQDCPAESGEADRDAAGGSDPVRGEEQVQPAHVEEGRLGHVDDDGGPTGVAAKVSTQLRSQRRCGGPVEFAAQLDDHRVGVHLVHGDAEREPRTVHGVKRLVQSHGALPCRPAKGGHRRWRRAQNRNAGSADPAVVRAEAGAKGSPLDAAVDRNAVNHTPHRRAVSAASSSRARRNPCPVSGRSDRAVLGRLRGVARAPGGRRHGGDAAARHRVPPRKRGSATSTSGLNTAWNGLRARHDLKHPRGALIVVRSPRQPNRLAQPRGRGTDRMGGGAPLHR
jgi:hypothetical protein